MQDRPLVHGSAISTILAADEPPPVAVHNAGANSPFLLLGDHAGNRIPSSLGQLGLDATERGRHIAWDIGIAELGVRLADMLGASFIHQAYSRLVIDCNRRPGAPDSIPAVSDGTPIPGNTDLNPTDAKLRETSIHEPYQEAIAADLDRRQAEGRSTILVALHSFTPRMSGNERPWQVGVLHDAGDTRFAVSLLDTLARFGLVVGDNEPYSMDTIDFTVPFHAYSRALPYAEIEVRQDLLADSHGIAEWSHHLERALLAAQQSYDTIGRLTAASGRT